MSDFSQGLVVSIVGLLVTFTALGVFILVMIVLQKLFPPRHEVEEEETSEAASEEVIDLIAAEEAEGENEEIVAAIAAVIALRNRQSGQLGSALVSGPGPFWTNQQSFPSKEL